MAREIRTLLQGECLALVVDGTCIATAKRYPIGWVVKSQVSRPWISASKIPGIAGRPTNVTLAMDKREARRLLNTL